MKALTPLQSQILREMIDFNWEADNLDNSYHERDIARQKYYTAKRQFIESMGIDAYNEFMEMGRAMFAPAQS